jgi:hypothetical protein
MKENSQKEHLQSLEGVHVPGMGRKRHQSQGLLNNRTLRFPYIPSRR